MSQSEWISTAVKLTRAHMPHVTESVARAIAEELHDAWPGLTPSEAVTAYWELPVF
ncbi:MAG: hypothetical protein ABI605_10790 [Rhizobacter sp.]